MSKKITTHTVNKAIAKLGGQAKLEAGDGYWYFYDGEADYFFQQSVYTFRLNSLPLESWVEEWKSKVLESSVLDNVPEYADLRKKLSSL